MKKCLCLFLLSTLILAVSACGGKPGETAEEETLSGGSGQESREQELQKTEPMAESVRQESENTYTDLNEFQAGALDGSTFTQEDFADRDVTVINFWALSCGPCIAEMPALAELEKVLPENVQLITVCLDGGGNEDLVTYVLEESGFEGITLLSGDGDLLELSRELQYTPTTLFADSEGNTVGDVIVGGRENLAEVYLRSINSILTEMGKAEISVGTDTE